LIVKKLPSQPPNSRTTRPLPLPKEAGGQDPSAPDLAGYPIILAKAAGHKGRL
jgi:hypothetical protein